MLEYHWWSSGKALSDRHIFESGWGILESFDGVEQDFYLGSFGYEVVLHHLMPVNSTRFAVVPEFLQGSHLLTELR